jgi:hypothetical protein
VGAPRDNDWAGAAWVWTRSDNTWTQQAKLVGSGFVSFSGQGTSVALSADGNIAIVGGPTDNPTCQTCGGLVGAGAFWVWTRNAGVWSQQGPKLIGSIGSGWNESPGVGSSVALSADGATAVVGKPDDNVQSIFGGVVAIGAATVFFNQIAPTVPIVVAISPNSGSPAGGTSVTILGSNFSWVTGVYFGSVAASSFTINSAGSIAATSPAGNGTIDVTATGPNGSSATSAADQFTYTITHTHN